MRFLRKGSLTVEASFLLPFLLFLIFAFLCLCMYLHDRSVLASCAAEVAGKGAAEKYREEKELERWLEGQANGLAAGRLLAVRELAVKAEVTSKKVTVTYWGKTPLLGGLEIREQETAKRMNPVTFIRGGRRFSWFFKE